MCELIGFSAAAAEDIRVQLEEFFSHSETNPHGWGLMYADRLVKGCEKASESEKLRRLLEILQPQKTLLGHIRYKTVGSVSLENCHPFTGRDITGRQWTLIHDGTIFSSSRLIPYLSRQTGNTDSERLFLYLLDLVSDAQENGEQTLEERCQVIDGFVRELAPRNKLNLMIYDGELL